jgi:hypothetical protein
MLETAQTVGRSRTALIRLFAALIAIFLLTMFVTARWLEPEISGLGTHQQLGLPPCSVRMVFGIRCPSCGMTTSWAHLANGNLIGAANANLGGMLLAFSAAWCVPFACRLAFLGHIPQRRTIHRAMIGLTAIAAVTLVEWAVRLAWLRLAWP